MNDPNGVRFTTHPSSGDILWNATALMRRSPLSLVLGTFMVATGAVAVALGDLVSLLILLVGLSFLSGVFVAPFTWWSIRQRKDLVLAPADIEATAQGLSMTSSMASSRQAWSFYRRARETRHAFLLEIGTGSVVLLTKRDIAPADVQAFRVLLVQAGLLSQQTSKVERWRPLLWVAVGLVVSAALLLGPRIISGMGATATLEVAPTIQGRTVTLQGTTDLPDGAIVVVQLVQRDAWERESAGGVTPDVGTSPWVRSLDARVQGGRFTQTFQVADWPAGRGVAAAFFWIDATQPRAVIDRFGPNGTGLRGPNVTDRDDRGPTLEIERAFVIPE